jgi:hypothetical protein
MTSTGPPMTIEQQLREMNEALLVSSVRQHELAEQALGVPAAADLSALGEVAETGFEVGQEARDRRAVCSTITAQAPRSDSKGVLYARLKARRAQGSGRPRSTWSVLHLSRAYGP